MIHWLTPQLEVECRLPGLFDEVQQQLVVRQEEIEGGKPLRLKTITLTAKDKICPLEERVCTPEACPRANGYYDRINAALYEFLSQTDEFTRADIEAFKGLAAPAKRAR